VTTEADNRLII